MTIKTRQQVREKIGALINTDFTTIEIVYDYLKTDFQGQSPVITIGSEGAHPEAQDFTQNMAIYTISVNIFVTRVEEEAAEDQLDAVMQEVFTFCENYRTLDGWWDDLTWPELSQIAPANIGGEAYWMESLVLRIYCYA